MSIENPSTSTTSTLISVQDHGRVRVLTFNHPPSNNLSFSFFDSLEKELDTAQSNSNTRAVLLTSAIPKYFSAGLELSELFSAEERTRAQLFMRLVEIHKKLARFPKPTVAAIEGSAFLGGFVLALGCDSGSLPKRRGECL